MRFTYQPKGVCSNQIIIDLEEKIVRKIQFVGGCEGNLSAIALLVAGLSIDDVQQKLAGIKCGRKKTSCPDQLAQAIAQAYAASGGVD